MIQSSLHKVNDGYDVGIWLAIFDLFNTHKEKIWVSWGYACTGNYWSGAARWFRQLDGRKPSTRRTFDEWCCRTRESMQRWSLDCGCLRVSGKLNGAKMARNAEKYKKYPRHSSNFYFNPAIRRTSATFVSQWRLMYSSNAEAFDSRLKIILSGWIKYCLSFLCVHKNTNLCKHLQSSGFEFFYCAKLRRWPCKGRKSERWWSCPISW